LNETGDVFLLTQDFDPATSLVLYLTDTASLDVNDPIYLSNSVVSGDDGLFATVAAVDHGANTVTIANTYVASMQEPDFLLPATFDTGSICEEVPLVTYASAADGSGITRNSGFGPVVLAANTTMQLEYLDLNGAPITLPLTNSIIINSMRSIRVTINHTSSNKMVNGQPYVATVSQAFGIRNLNYFF
jgi:hypothetical protein